MMINSAYKKSMYQFKFWLEKRNEKERIILLAISVLVVLLSWFLIFFHPAMELYSDVNLKAQDKQKQTEELIQKKTIIDSVINYPTTQSLLARHEELKHQIEHMDKQLSQYSQHYLSKRELSKLLHDMLKQTMGVSIIDFYTVITPPTEAIQEAAPNASPTSTTALNRNQTGFPLINPTQYRLVIRGTYFAIMNYLKHLEKMPWNLYWDKFYYVVSKYPEGVATLEFYTLKPDSEVTKKTQGGTQ